MANHADAAISGNGFFYDVFLSFRGEGGTRYGFTDHLYKVLRQKGIYTFRDNEEVKIGEELKSALPKAIENSRMLIPVLCQNYATSTWCLDELANIVDCYDKGKQVLVIFYKVEPCDVWEQKNSYEKAMIEHEERFGKDSDKVKSWRSALSKLRHLSAEHCCEDRDESEVINKIVKDTLAKLTPLPLQMKRIVGLDSRVEQLKSLIDNDSSDAVCMLGIYGVGGIGKTTLAINLYDKIRHEFEAASFLANVREKSNCSINGLEDLQRTLLSEVGEDTGPIFRGSSEIKDRLGHKRLLLVLDDVDAVEQLRSLAGGCDWFGPGSRIIITSRDVDVLHKHNDKIKEYKMEELSDHDSIELFCWQAFNMSKPAKDFADISVHAAHYAKGNPLALTVIGSNLKGRSVEECEIELCKYSKVPNADIQGVLEISYKSLSALDRKVFLDIACFFKGEKWDYVERILSACEFHPIIRVFISKCLITIDENDCLEMHDLIQDMGREVVRKESPLNPGDRSRLWSHKDILRVLKENLGSGTIEGMIIHPPGLVEIDDWTHTAFEKMENLRILIVRNTRFSKGPSYLPNSLQLLEWNGYPSKSFHKKFYPQKIVDFKLPHSSLILENPFQIFEELTFINVSNCQNITQIPDVSGAKCLRVLTLDNCSKLVRFDNSIGFMPKLVYLSATKCTMLTSFVPKMYLPSLQVLSFSFCKKFEHFPHVMEKMDSPLKIYMINTAIKEFPKSICNLIGLGCIDMTFCQELKDLPSSFLLLPNLVTLKIDGCPQLGESFKRFKERYPMAKGCPNLVTLSCMEVNLSNEDFDVILEEFPKLEELSVSYNGFVSLPESITGSLHLKSIDLTSCRNLTEIPKLPLSIKKVDARSCRSLTSTSSSELWSKVEEEMQRIQVVMPATEIPEWFDFVCTEEIPCFWARRKFPIVALALVFQGVKEQNNGNTLSQTALSFPNMERDYVNLNLFIDGQEIRGRDYHCFIVEKDHVLICDLRLLLSVDEWNDIDASFGDDWKAIQVQCDSKLILSKWGIYVDKKESNINDIDIDIQFNLPNLKSSNKIYTSSAISVSKRSRHLRHLIETSNPVDHFNKIWLITDPPKDLEETSTRRARNRFLTHWSNMKAKGTREEASPSFYGASLKQEHEELPSDLLRIFEMIKENAPQNYFDSCSSEVTQGVWLLLEGLLESRKEELSSSDSTGCYSFQPLIILQDTDSEGVPRYQFWGNLDIEVRDPFFEPVFTRLAQIGYRTLTPTSVEAFRRVSNMVLLKCQRPEEASSSSVSEEEYYDPQLEEFFNAIEQDAMRFNKSYGKIKAFLVQMEEPTSQDYETEKQLFELVLSKYENFGMFLVGYKKTPYGYMRSMEDSTSRFRKLCVLLLIMVCSRLVLKIGKLFKWSWRLVLKPILFLFLLFLLLPCLLFTWLGKPVVVFTKQTCARFRA